MARILGEMDLDRLRAEATDVERCVIIEGLLESVAMYRDDLQVAVSVAPRLNVTLEEVGLNGEWQSCGVGGPTRTLRIPLVISGKLQLVV